MESLSKLRVPASELAQYQSVTHIGNVKQQKLSVTLAKRPDIEIKRAEELNGVKGAKRRKLEKWPEPEYESSSSSESENDDEREHGDEPISELTEKIEENVEKAEEIVQKPPPNKLCDPRLDWVAVNRPEKIQEDRLELPILSEEGSVLEAVAQNDVILICGETGSGKTTQGLFSR